MGAQWGAQDVSCDRSAIRKQLTYEYTLKWLQTFAAISQFLFLYLRTHRLLACACEKMKYFLIFLFLLGKKYDLTHGASMWLSNRTRTTAECNSLQFFNLVCAKYEIIYIARAVNVFTLFYFHFLAIVVKPTIQLRPQQWFQFFIISLAIYNLESWVFAVWHHTVRQISRINKIQFFSLCIIVHDRLRLSHNMCLLIRYR